MFAHLKKIDWLLVCLAVTLASFGLLSLYSSGGEQIVAFKKQVLWLTLGLVFMIFVSFFDYRIFKNYQAPAVTVYLISVILLIGVLIFGISVRGAESWYRFGAITVEPVEFTKVALIVLFAKYFSMRHIEMYRVRHIVTSGFYVLVPAALVFLQSEIGSVLILISIWLGIMLIAGIRIRHLFFLGLLGLLAAFIAWNFVLQDYQKERLLSFVNPESDPRGAGYNVLQSLIAIGSGGVRGSGLGEGSQTQLGFLPEPQTDFIFSAIAEELGLGGVLLLLFCFLFFFRQLLNISKNSSGNFARLLASGFSTMLLAQIFINAGMTMGILPITGIPLPFVSYGGSSLISLFIMIGILQSVKINSR